MQRQPDDYDYEGHRIVYVNGTGNGNSRLGNWALGIAATLITAVILGSAALLWNMNSTMTIVIYRLTAVEQAVDRASK